jgi:hypothetical protein
VADENDCVERVDQQRFEKTTDGNERNAMENEDTKDERGKRIPTKTKVTISSKDGKKL